VRAVLEHDDIAETARAMYETHYYEGLSTDPEANIRAYGARLAELEPTIAAALSAPASPVVPVSLPGSASRPSASPLRGSPSSRGATVRYGERTSSPALVLLLSGVLVLASSLLQGAQR
jgi:hypothetical protein